MKNKSITYTLHSIVIFFKYIYNFCQTSALNKKILVVLKIIEIVRTVRRNEGNLLHNLIIFLYRVNGFQCKQTFLLILRLEQNIIQCIIQCICAKKLAITILLNQESCVSNYSSKFKRLRVQNLCLDVLSPKN